MHRRMRRILLAVSVAVGLVAVAVALSAPTASAYGKANWQAAFSGSFTYPHSELGGFGFWGWCDFAGGVTSGNDADCQISEYVHNVPFLGGTSFNCELSIDATSWDDSGSTVDGEPAFAVTGSAVIHPARLTQGHKDACMELFAGTASTSFDSANTFIPAVAGHFSYPDFVAFFGATGVLNFTVKELP
jgi:hypothetical protein